MKKLIILALAISSMALISCSEDPTERAQEFNNAISAAYQKGDTAQFDKLIKEAIEYKDKLSDEDKEAFNKVYNVSNLNIYDVMEPEQYGPELELDSTYGENVPEPAENGEEE